MENLFDYATKELSQDAFLRWFFKSYKDEQFKPIVADFISTFTKGQLNEQRPQLTVDKDDYSIIEAFAQLNDIDISIDIQLSNGKRTLVIEDKTDSEEHNNQLETYNKRIEKWKYPNGSFEQCVYKIFYKTSTIDRSEKDRVERAGWTCFDLDSIWNFFKKYQNKTNSDVLNDYINHLQKLINESKNEFLPKKHNILEWKSFFEKTVKPNLKNCDVYVNETYFGYAYLNVRPTGKEKNKTPYLEIRSRDCLDGGLIGRILLYGVEDNKDFDKLKDIVANSSLFHKENNSKQIGSTKRRNQEKIKYSSEEDFIKQIERLSDEYLRIMKEWDSVVSQ